jgi:hypothetical protein
MGLKLFVYYLSKNPDGELVASTFTKVEILPKQVIIKYFNNNKRYWTLIYFILCWQKKVRLIKFFYLFRFKSNEE